VSAPHVPPGSEPAPQPHPAAQQASTPPAPPANGPAAQTGPPPHGFAPANGWAPPTAPPPSSGNAVKIAIVLAGAVVALVLVVAVIGFAGGRDTETTPTGGGSTTPEPTTPTEPTIPAEGGGEPAPESGSLVDLVPEDVGDFTLAEIEEFPEAIDNGAIEAYKLVYRGPGGAAYHTIEAHGDEESALDLHQGLVASLIEDGSHEVTDEAELEHGTVTALASTEDPTRRIVVWNNGPILATTYGVGDPPIDLYDAHPY
jgi:hypothetical protein